MLGNKTDFSVSYTELHNDVKVGGSILVDDGYLELKIKQIDGTKIICEALNTHTIADRRGINVPGIVLNIPFMSEKDRSDYIFGCEQNVDYMALSFVQRAQDVLEVRKILKEQGKENIKLIAKLENQGACDNFEEILNVVDGIMVARGDLGVEVPA
jgi:pyruvate kinase